jgi:anti-sigma-K factor RskA
MNTNTEELACLYVLDQLDERERAAFEARLVEDPELGALVRELETALSRRVHALPQHAPPARVLANIESRIDRLHSGTARKIVPLWASVARWGIAAVIAVGVGIVAVQSLRRPSQASGRPYVILVGLDSLSSKLAQLPVKDKPGNADASFIQLASLAEKYWEKPEELPVKLDSAGESGRGYAIFDPGSNQGFIAIRQLAAVESGKQYRLWLVDTDSGKVREAGVLPAAGSTSGLYFFSVAPVGAEKLDRFNFFVTAEDSSAPDSAEPRGKVVLGDRRI